MVTFIDITESIVYIRNKSKQKVIVERILIQLKKKEQYEDLTLCTLEKEIATLFEAGMLHSNDNDSIFINNVLNAPTREQTIVNKESEENSDIDDTTKSSPANDIIQPNEDTSALANRIETLQNFFLHEISDLRSEMKNMHECNKTNDSHVECNKRMELMENQINFLQEECNFKTKLINSLLENLFNHENHQTKLHNNNATLTPGKADDDFQFPKRQACKRSCQSQSNPKLTLSNRYESLRHYDISERNDDVMVTKVSHLPPEEHASEKNVKTSDSRKQNIKRERIKETNLNKKIKHKRNFR